MRHQAWLNATPKEAEKSRRASYTEGSPYLDVTPLSSYESWILELWYKAGTVGQGAHGLIPLSWEEITSWADRFYSETYIEWVEHPRISNRHKPVYTPIPIKQSTLLDEELEWIHRMSCEYSSEYAAANDPNRECPVTIVLEDIPEEQAIQNADAIREAMIAQFGNREVDTSVEAVPNK